MKLVDQQRWRLVATFALTALIVPLLLGGFPGLHIHGQNGLEPELLSIDHDSGNKSGCSLCALNRSLGQSRPGSPSAAIGIQVRFGPEAIDIIQPTRRVPADSDPRAPPVHDSIWNV